MVSQNLSPEVKASLFKIEQIADKIVHKGALPDSCLLLESIRPLEVELQNRKIISAHFGSLMIHPLWFVAETERNVFLWRNGFSLNDESLFEFWVDFDGLINKRLHQLDNPSGDNPFINSLWGLVDEVKDSSRYEKEYLFSLRDAINSIAVHAHAISQVAHEVRKAVLDTGHERPRVLLPMATNL